MEGSTIVLTPEGGKYNSVVVFMHGLGDSGNGWIDAVEGVFARAPRLQSTKFYVPSAPSMPVTLNNGYVMPAWYDITALSANRADQPCKGIQDSRSFIRALLSKEVEKHGVAWSKIVLAGFSQGGAMSLYAGLTSEKPIGGIACLSGYLPLPKDVASEMQESSKSVPVRMFHGDEGQSVCLPYTYCSATHLPHSLTLSPLYTPLLLRTDEVVRLEWAQQSKAKLTELGVSDISLSLYAGMGHSATMKELQEVTAFLTKVLQ